MKTKLIRAQGRPRKQVSLELTLGNTKIQSKGVTALEALQNLKKPVKIFTKGTLKITKGGFSNEMALPIVRVKRLFYPLAQPYLAKQISFGLK